MNLLKKYFGKIIISSGILFIATFGLTACQSETDGGPLGPTNLTNSSANITVSPATLSLAKLGTQTFTAIGGSGTFTWSVDNQTLGAIVADTGVFTAGNSNGSVTVTATDFNGATGTATVTVTDKSLTLTPSALSIGKQGAQDFTLTGGTEPIFFSVDNATLGSFGATTGNTAAFTAGISIGTATVTATDADGDTVTGTVTIVSNPVTVTPASVTFTTAGDAQEFTATSPVVGVTFSFALSGQSNSYAGTTITTSANTGTATVTGTTLPTALEGTQTLTLTVTDSNGDTGVAQITVNQ